MATHTVLAPRRVEVAFPLVAIGFSNCENSQRIAKFLCLLGFELHQHDVASGLDTLLDTYRKTTLLVYSPVGSSAAADVIETLEGAYRFPPVIVVSDRVDMGQYHDLMSRGIADYFAESEDSEYIARAVEWIAKTRSA